MRYLIPLVFACLIGLSACEKKGPADAVITVTDSAGRRISGALVILHQDSVVSPVTGSQAVINEQKTTDGSGQAAFSFKLPAVLFIDASKGNLSCRDYISLEEDKQVAKTVVIR